MMQFYRRLFPYRPFFHWLNHDHTPSKLFTHQEFALTLSGDIYLRYNSFATVEDFAREIKRLNPSRFEVGAIYNARPRDKRTLRAGALQPLMRELVFDIDMTDYDSPNVLQRQGHLQTVLVLHRRPRDCTRLGPSHTVRLSTSVMGVLRS
ncbi:prim-pol domain-containing protein, partial [Calocera cornea HHB12733]